MLRVRYAKIGDLDVAESWMPRPCEWSGVARLRKADSVTSVLAVAVLLPGLGSNWLESSLALLVIVVELTPRLESKLGETFAVIVSEMLAPFAMLRCCR
jgi:hypothetical protein